MALERGSDLASPTPRSSQMSWISEHRLLLYKNPPEDQNFHNKALHLSSIHARAATFALILVRIKWKKIPAIIRETLRKRASYFWRIWSVTGLTNRIVGNRGEVHAALTYSGGWSSWSSSRLHSARDDQCTVLHGGGRTPTWRPADLPAIPGRLLLNVSLGDVALIALRLHVQYGPKPGFAESTATRPAHQCKRVLLLLLLLLPGSTALKYWPLSGKISCLVGSLEIRKARSTTRCTTLFT